MSFKDLTLQQRVTAANIDCMRHPKYALLSAIISMGKSEVAPHTKVPTACTNGRDKQYGDAFIEPLNRKQLRYVVLHENFHCALLHCTHFKDVCTKHPRLSNQAMDYVVNAMIEELDPHYSFIERPIPTLLYDAKYIGWSFPEVFNDLFKQGKGGQGKGGEGSGGGSDAGDPLDEHEQGEMSEEEAEGHERDVADALRQGDILAKRLQGKGAGGRDIFGIMSESHTDYASAMRDWITTICKGDENSRWCPPNRRLLALGIIMPSHFDESIGELIVAADTSGSMHPYYDMLFSEVAQVCKQVRPDGVRVIWWDDGVQSEQLFKPDDYDKLGAMLKPRGGGGTVPEKVAAYIAEKEYKPRGVLWLTDGYIGGGGPVLPVPALWGVVNNRHFVPAQGKVVHITKLGA